MFLGDWNVRAHELSSTKGTWLKPSVDFSWEIPDHDKLCAIAHAFQFGCALFAGVHPAIDIENDRNLAWYCLRLEVIRRSDSDF